MRPDLRRRIDRMLPVRLSALRKSPENVRSIPAGHPTRGSGFLRIHSARIDCVSGSTPWFVRAFAQILYSRRGY